MKKVCFVFILLLSFISHCQSWQWGKRGGALEAIPGGSLRQEETYFLTTDSHKNIYGLSTVGKTGLNIDNVVKSNFDDIPAPLDIALFSFACDGSYRWSKIIGGIGPETISSIKIDAQDNIYIAGRLGICNQLGYPPRIDNDISQDYDDCRIMFIAKYNTNGILQWIKKPQAANIDQTTDSAAFSRGLEIDQLGNLYWLCWLPQGTYANGAYTNSSAERKWVVLKYDSNGAFLNAIPINMQTSQGFAYFLKFQRNPYNGNFYFYSVTGDQQDDFATLGGNTVTHSTFLSSFDSNGAYLWHREDTFTSSGYFYIYNLDFDPQNNIYIGGKIVGADLGSFIGFSVPDPVIPGFVMKTNPNASQVLWSSYNNKLSENYGGIVLNGNELGYTSYCAGTDFSWGTQTLNASNINNNDGVEVLLARFNKDSGACIGLTKIPGNNGFNDVGASITADASGDYIVGGAMGGTLTFNSGQIVNGGSQSDFFVAKYATQVCSPLAINQNPTSPIQLYPNPTTGTVQFDNSNSYFQKATVYDLLGQEVIKPFNLQQGGKASFDLNNLPNGVYLVKLEGNFYNTIVKLIKK
jgi:hypothetical protein